MAFGGWGKKRTAGSAVTTVALPRVAGRGGESLDLSDDGLWVVLLLGQFPACHGHSPDQVQLQLAAMTSSGAIAGIFLL